MSRVTGMSYGATVMVVLFSFTMFMLFHISLALSRLQARQSQVARQVALTAERLRRVEESRDDSSAPSPQPSPPLGRGSKSRER